MAGARESRVTLAALGSLALQAVEQLITAAILGAFFAGDLLNRFTRHHQWQHKVSLSIDNATQRRPEAVVIRMQLAQFFLAIAQALVNVRFIAYRADRFYFEELRQHHCRFDQQPFREQPVAGFGRALDRFVRHMGFWPLQPANIERGQAIKRADGEGEARQRRLQRVIKGERRFALFIQRGI